MANPTPLDPVALFSSIAALVVGPTLAPVIGAYAVILLAATVGAGWSLSRRDPDAKKTSVLLFLLLVDGTALFLTAGLAEVVRAWLGWETTPWLLAPIALGIGLIGDEWPAVGRSVAAFIGNQLGRWAERRGDQR